MADTLANLGQGSSNANVAKIAIEQRKKKADVVEPQVISEELLIEGVEEPIRPDGEAWEPIDFPRVTSLRLSFKNIIEISNLNNFDSLLTLRLDNNIIDKIANLGHLKQLTWLDLSFNNIREIEGLGELHELLDLSLYHNQIEEIRDRLDGCPKLNILSLGHNNIQDLRQIDYLRQFQNLRCLCMDSNKICLAESYNQHVLAYLPHLKYLDYMLIDRKAVAQAQEGYDLEGITEVREKEQTEQARQKALAEKQAVIEKLKTAFLDCTENLFEEMFSKEVEPDNVLALACYPGLKEDYRDKLSEEIKGLRSRMEEKNDVRLRKVVAFEKAVYAAETESEEEAFQAIRDFKSLKKKVLSQIDREDNDRLRSEVDELIKQLMDQLSGLENHLMANEIQVQESIEEALSDFEAKISDLVKGMLDNSREFFQRLEELEKSFITGLTEGANTEIESFTQASESAMADTDPQKAKYLNNREEMNQALTNFTDAHNSLIQNHSDPVPAARVELAKPWIEAFGESLVCCLFSREWNVRETALRRLSKDINTVFLEGSSTQNMAAFEAGCSLLSMMCGDPVYRVYVAALRTLRVLVMHMTYSTQQEKRQIQKYLFGVVEAVLAKCADSNRRISTLSIQVLLELCKDESGDLALGKMLGEQCEPQSLGGVNFVLSCILRTAAEYATWPWWLGRLMFLRKLMDEYVNEFELSADCASVQMDTAGVLIQARGANVSEDANEIYQGNVTRLMSVLKFTMQAAYCSHSKVSKLAIAVLMSCTSLASQAPSAFKHIRKVVSKLKPAQRSALHRQLQTIPRVSTAPSQSSDTVDSIQSLASIDPPSSNTSYRDSAIGSLSSAASDDETDNFSECELFQSIVDTIERPESLCFSPNTISPSKELNLDWSRSIEDSPQMPPVKLAVGKKCMEIIEQEEAEAMARAIAVSSRDRGPSKIASLDSGDEMVIVFTQPESLEKAVNSKHLYLEGVHWKKGELLGTGAYSSCYAVRDLMNGSLMAVKQVSFCRNSTEEQEKVTQTIDDEISLLGRLQHPHLIKCLGATKHTGHFNIFLEWMPGGSITNLLKKYGPFDEKIVISYTRQILQGVAYLHQNQVIHRDIKGANILVDSSGQNIRIADFGAAARLATQLTGAGEFQGQLLGTIAFMAPEVLRGESYGRSCDVWSVGCVIIEMAVGKPPWNAHEHSNHLALIFKIACAECPPDIPENLNPALRDVLLRCLEGKQNERPSAMELLKHPLFTQM